MNGEYTIYVRDKDMNIVGMVDDYKEFTATLQFCDVGTWQIKISCASPHAELFQPNTGIVVHRKGVERVLMSGTVTGIQKYWTVDEDSGAGAFIITGYDDNYIAKNHICYPDPLQPIDRQDWDTDAHTDFSAARSIEGLISANSGADSVTSENRAPAGYDTPGDRNPAWPYDNFGDKVPYSVRYDNLLDAVKPIATKSGLGWRNVYDHETRKIKLECWQVKDLSQLIRFSPEIGNLKQFVYSQNAPKCTRAILGARGDGHLRYVKTYTDKDSEDYWGIIAEQFFDVTDVPIMRDKDSGSPILDPNYQGETLKTLEDAQRLMDQKGASHLKENGPTGNLQLYPLDTPQSMFGRDWWIGDKVTCIVDGDVHSDPVTKVVISDTADGTTVTPSLGAQGTTESANVFTEIKALWRQISELKSRR
ncbi:siphovirus ReqiPepy6 Gp37-like family protein [Streptomyces sp. 769]|uniref:Gp37-like protein n=1 Tax=Streptomyces sp. 769 TaxID=1262452 RepID=UPI00057F2592|nr:siphovirus ReqiPepy6 Gp37-like family protein [Streptomyces sp. 769]AJC54002.1 hypothetical protein GZL_01402 [Streptomyces sp. 769]